MEYISDSENFVKDLIRYWEEDTMLLSYHDMDHPAISIIKKIASLHPKMVVSCILNYVQQKESWAFTILREIIPSENCPVCKEEDRGVFHALRNMWIQWGIDKGYILKETTHAKRAVMIFSDGACEGNPGKGGYGSIIKFPDGSIKQFCEGFFHTTNNRMELMGVIIPLRFLSNNTDEKLDIIITTDSQYVANAFNKNWLKNWKKKGWRKADGEKVLNQDLWKEIDDLCKKHNVSFKWVRGHNSHPENEECDLLAVASRNAPFEDLRHDKEFEKTCKNQ